MLDGVPILMIIPIAIWALAISGLFRDAWNGYPEDREKEDG